jgi:hypothetical protein
MDISQETPSERVLATPELLELILVPLLGQLRDPLEREDPRSPKTRLNANILHGLLSLRLVNRVFDGIMTSSCLQIIRQTEAGAASLLASFQLSSGHSIAARLLNRHQC